MQKIKNLYIKYNEDNNKNTLILILSIFIILAITLFSICYIASARGFTTANTNWHNENNNMDSNPKETFPYNSTSAAIKSVSMDILYGTTRGLVTYYGEMPYDQIYTDDDEILEGFEGFYAENGTSAIIDSVNPSYGATISYIDPLLFVGTKVFQQMNSIMNMTGQS